MLSIILPCRNEERGLPVCLRNIHEAFKSYDYEIIVSDSSRDRSPEIAKSHGVKLVKHDRFGYGIAYREAFKEALGDYILMGDCDGTYAFADLLPMVQKLDEGFDLVVGNRFMCSQNKAHMPYMHWKVGNPILSSLARRIFKVPISDTQCGLRAAKKQALMSMPFKSTHMEFASEMVIRFQLAGFKMTESIVGYHPRIGRSKLRPVRDGLRHLGLIFALARDRAS